MFGFFNKKNKKSDIDVSFDKVMDRISQIDDYDDPQKVKRYILDSCEQIIAATKEIEAQKAEYRVLTKYLDDITTLSKQPKERLKNIEKCASNIYSLQRSRDEFLNKPKSISDSQFILMQENEETLPDEIRRMQENEVYQDRLYQQMHALETDKGEAQLDLDEVNQSRRTSRKISILAMIMFASVFIFLILLRSTGYSRSNEYFGIALVLGAVSALLIFLWQSSNAARQRSLINNRNNTINRLNVVRMKYANVTRAVNYIQDKYHVKSSHELNFCYEKYLETVRDRKQFAEDNDDLEYWNEKMMKLLNPVNLYDSKIWLEQAGALINPEDMDKVRNDLVQRRAAVRAHILENTRSVKDDRDEIDRLMTEKEFNVPEIIQIIESVDRLCGLNSSRNNKTDKIDAVKAAEPVKPAGSVVRSAEKQKNNKERKKMSKVRTRFAPSPTGRMHVGNLRTALYAYLIARHAGGDFILRIEDTDQERHVEGAEDIIYRTMQETGLEHDEGPDKDGGVGPYIQSERQAQGLYLKYAKMLVDKGEAYYCFCTPERLESLKHEVTDENGETKVVSVYDKHCLSLSKEEVEKNLAEGKPYVIRQNNPRTGTTTFHDEIYGDITVDNSELDDMILIKSDGYPTYNFANVVDDHLMGITHVVRGNEYLSSSPKYNRLYDAFGWDVPKYIHCPPITNENHKKLSKRDGASSFEDLVNEGYLPEAIVNFVALLGWSPEGNQEIMSKEELIKAFDYKRINTSPAVFDRTKLKWMNGEYIKKMDPEAFYEKALPYINETVKRDCDKRKIAELVQTRIEIFPDINEMVDFFEQVPDYDSDMYINKKNKTDKENSLALLKDVLPVLEAQDDFSNDALFALLKDYAAKNEKKVGFVMWPLRTALSGKESTPGGATAIMEILGKEESVARIRAAIDKLTQ